MSVQVIGINISGLEREKNYTCKYKVKDTTCEAYNDHVHFRVTNDNNDTPVEMVYICNYTGPTYTFRAFRREFLNSPQEHDTPNETPELEYLEPNTPDLAKKILEILEKSDTASKFEPEAGSSYRVPIDARFDLIPPISLKRLANVYGEGAVKYGESEYLAKTLKASNVINHMMNHLMLFMCGDKKEDHAAKVAWGAFTLMVLEELKSDMIDVRNYGKALEIESMLVFDPTTS